MKMRILWIWFFALLFVLSCQDKPEGESDDAVDINGIESDLLYAYSGEVSGSALQLNHAEGWHSDVFQQDDKLTFRLDFPRDFTLPADPDLPDSTPGKVAQIGFALSVQTSNGEILFEKSTTSDLNKAIQFQYELPDLSLYKLKTGKHKLLISGEFFLEGSKGTKVSGVSAFNLIWLRDIPPIYKTQVHFKEFRLTDEHYEQSKSANDGLGNPLPDLFWTFSVDEVVRFKSSTYENSNPYLIEKMNFNIYHLSVDPRIEIKIFDDDYTSINDKLADWKGLLSALNGSDWKSLKMKGLDHFMIYSDSPKICNP